MNVDIGQITKEKAAIADAPARASMHSARSATGRSAELEAADLVLARYSKGTPARKTASAKTPTTATNAAVFTATKAPAHQCRITLGNAHLIHALPIKLLAWARARPARNRRFIQRSCAPTCRRRRSPRQKRAVRID